MALFDTTLAHLPTTAVARPQNIGMLPAPTLQLRPARPARLRRRHLGLILTFALFVLLPIAMTGWYLWARAADQYASTLGFSVRKENLTTPLGLLGGLSSITGSSSADTDILYDYMHSQKLVAEIDAKLDLRAIWSKPLGDPVFAFAAPGSIESLLKYWSRRVQVTYDNATRLIEIRVLAFDPSDAQAIAAVLFDKSTAMINHLNDVAQDDALGLAAQERDKAEARLSQARVAMTEFRNRTQSIDPASDLQNQTGLLANLQTQLAEALIDSDMLSASTRNPDTRSEQAALRIKVIKDRISAEKAKLGLGGTAATAEVFATKVGEFERLSVDREFAETAYRAAQLAYEAALADARRQTLYLAAHITPTLAETAEFPQRQMILATAAIFLLLAWSIAAMIYYSLRDRR